MCCVRSSAVDWLLQEQPTQMWRIGLTPYHRRYEVLTDTYTGMPALHGLVSSAFVHLAVTIDR